jgi:predicted nucleotidyltransferase
MSLISVQKLMLTEVAIALGDELLKDVVFVGGCSTGLLVTDEFTKEQIRYTDDVDLIVDVVGYPAWIVLQEQLGRHGFTIDMGEEVICRMLLGELKVDFMPIDSGVLGFTNRWYKDAVTYAQDFVLNEQITIKLISPEYFVATKLEAYLGRGKGDALASHDIEDLLNIFDGRQAINAEVKSSSTELQHYISTQLSALLEDENFEYAIQSLTNGDAARENLIFERIQSLTQHG